MESLLLPKQVDVSNVTFGTPKTLDNGGKSIYVGINNKPLIIQTPEMEAPFGMSTWNTDKAETNKCTIELSFKGNDTNKAMDNFYKMLESLDTKLIEEGMTNSASWFKKKYNTTEVVEALYTHMLKHYKDKDTGEISDKYPPKFRLSVPFKEGKIACPIYDKNKELVELADIDKGSKVTAIIQCQGIWVAGGKFGCSWKVIQLLVAPPATFKGFAFKDVENEDNHGSDIDNVENKVTQTKEVVTDEIDVPEPDDESVDDKPINDDSVIDSSDDDDIEAPKSKVATKKVSVKTVQKKK
jgi:hypothetical protein